MTTSSIDLTRSLIDVPVTEIEEINESIDREYEPVDPDEFADSPGGVIFVPGVEGTVKWIPSDMPVDSIVTAAKRVMQKTSGV